MTWPATRAAALERLETFLPRAGRDYRTCRNYDRGPGRHVSVSGLSPYIRCRLVTEAEVLGAVLRLHSAASAEKFIQEVYWRTYWKGWLEQHPEAWHRYRRTLGQALDGLSASDEERARYAVALNGETGIDAFDAWIRELKDTGYLHNHARMWFASIWIFTLRLPWELGADFFLRYLLDGDPASNTLSWRWVAGLHTRGKTYLARADNIRRYTGDRFHALQALADRAEALNDEPLTRRALDLPPAELAGGRCGLLLTDEDLSLPDHCVPVAMAGWLTAPKRSILPIGEAVFDFASEALDDALRRGADRYDACSAGTFGPDDVDALLGWIRDVQLDALLVNYLPTGPARSMLDLLVSRLRKQHADIKIQPLVADHDRNAWPHAARGFFQMKKHIPELLRGIVSR